MTVVLVVVLCWLALAARAVAGGPPPGIVSAGDILPFSADLGDVQDVIFDNRAQCAVHPLGGPIEYHWAVAPLAPEVGGDLSGQAASFSIAVPNSLGFVFTVDVSVSATCGVISAYSANLQFGPYTVGTGPSPPSAPPSLPQCPASAATARQIMPAVRTAQAQPCPQSPSCQEAPYAPGCDRAPIAIPVLEKAKRQLSDPCDPKAFAEDPNFVTNCTAAKQKAADIAPTGPPFFCLVEVVFTTGYIFGAPVPKAVECLEKYGLPHKSSAQTVAHASAGTARPGIYRGFTTALGPSGHLPTARQLLGAGRRLGNWLLRGKRPARGAQRITFRVARDRRSTTFVPRMVLNCSTGSKLTIVLKDLPGTQDDLKLSGARAFKTTAEDAIAGLHISGRFFDGAHRGSHRHVVAGVLYLSLRSLHRGVCESLVGFAANR